MHQTLVFDTKEINWEMLAAVYAAEGFEGRTAETLRKNFEASDTVCFCFDINKLVGAARVYNGEIVDFCILKNALGYGPGLVMYEWLGKRSKIDGLSINAPEGIERELIENAELGEYLA